MKDIYSVNWKSTQCFNSLFPDGYLAIKEDTPVEFPLAVVPYPVGGHVAGTLRQQQRARLIAAAPELLRTLEGLIARIECANKHDCLLLDMEIDAAKTVINKAKGDE